MTFRGSPETNSLKIPIRNADGTVNIHCRKCGHFICRRNYTGFSTAMCHYCTIGEPRPEDPQEELLRQIYGINDLGTIEELSKPKKKFNILDLAINMVQALGFRKGKEVDTDQEEIVYPTADNESSKAIAKRKKREPIFSRKKE